jgi:formimidoylglutamate deiminase
MNLRGKTIVAERTWNGARFERDVAVRVDDRGVISAVDASAKPRAGSDVVRLDRRALLPGFVNAHSHAFQRGLRGTPQRFDAGSGNFWTWRETMYRLAGSLDVDGFYDASVRAFREMLAAGFTSVGEFHYLHHAGDDCADWAFDDAILAAAKDAGIRLVLIQCYYATGAIGRTLEGAQRRFGPVSRDEFVRQVERLEAKLAAATQTMALACHSIRAATLDDFRFFRELAFRNRWPFHVHVEEVRREIDDCLAAHGKTPMAALLDATDVDESVTAVHCTHSRPEDLTEHLRRGGNVCLCPITEGNLSDGFPDLPLIRSLGGRVCVGTDCNIRLSAVEELRWLEFGQRLRREKRGVVVGAEGSSAAGLIEIGTVNGARSLGLNAGAITAGNHADLLAIDLDHPDLQSIDEDHAVADAFVFGCGNGPIDQVWVAGEPRLP